MISNSTFLILFSKIDKLDIIKKVFGSITIPESVKNEVLVDGKPGFVVIQKAINDKWIKITNPKNRLNLNLGVGETDAISLAKEKNDILIIDDGCAIKAAKFYNINTIRTTTLIFIALKKKIINKKQAEDLLNGLIKEGYYIKPEEYSIILNKLKNYPK